VEEEKEVAVDCEEEEDCWVALASCRSFFERSFPKKRKEGGGGKRALAV